MIQLGVAQLPVARRETRNYESMILNQVLATATGSSTADAGALGALETASGVWARAFSGARVTPQNRKTAALTPAVLSAIARRLVRRGESCHLIDIDQAGRLRLLEASFWDVTGGARRPWRYQVTITGPSATETQWVSGDQVVHPMYAFSELQPWRGLGPLQWASTTGRLGVELEKALGDETSGPRGNLVIVPEGHAGDVPEGEADPMAQLQSDLVHLRGGLAMMETTAAGWGDKGGAPQADWRPRRLGADPPASLAEIRAGVEKSVLALCGVPPALATDADGTSQRESYRRFLHGSVSPVARLVEAELREKLDVPNLSISFDTLYAADLSGRARAWRSLVGRDAKMDAAKAARLAGLE